jgi:nucleoside-diphosphate-sugar epimerase
MKCLVTGAAGYVGSALIPRLTNDRHDVIGLLHQTTPQFHHNNVTYIHGDLKDASSLHNLPKKIDLVFHCAGLVHDYTHKESYYQLHVRGTKHLVEYYKKHSCKRFIFLSHIPYEKRNKKYPYPESKAKTEVYLLSEYKNQTFPAVIVRPGNIYGPQGSAWVIRSLIAIKNKKITLINNGKGIFHHTYIDNLIDALMLTMQAPDIEGEIIQITDDDNTVTFGRYFNDLARMIGMKPITRNLPYKVAKIIGYGMLFRYQVFGTPPLITPYAAEVLSNTHQVSLKKAKHLLNYRPKIDYAEGMKRIEEWISHVDIEKILGS